MRIIKVIGVLTIVAVMFTMIPVAYADAPPGNWVSGIACQNLESSPASITISFYPEGSSTAVLMYNDTIPANGSRNYYTPSTPPGLPDGFLGSAVVSSNTQLACNVNTQTTGTGTAAEPYRIGTSAGLADTETAATMYAPQVMKNLAGTWSSYIAVQNTDPANVEVDVTYKDSAGNDLPLAKETHSIPGFSNKVFYQASNANLPNDFVGAATIKANDGSSKLAVTVNFYNSGSSSETAQLHSYNGFSQGGTQLYVPRIVRNFYGYNGGLSIQNIGTSSTTVTIEFFFAGNNYSFTSGSIAPGAALPLYAPNISQLNPVDSLIVSQRFGSAMITSSGSPIVAIVNEDNRGGPGVPSERVGQGSSYNAIAAGSQTDSLFFAQITRKAGGIFSGGFQVANTTTTNGTCNITYSGVPGANETNVSLPANGSFARYAPNVSGLPDGFNASVSVVCTQPVVGISNLAAEPGTGKYGDSFTQANGLNR
jgi:hypothetical protein